MTAQEGQSGHCSSLAAASHCCCWENTCSGQKCEFPCALPAVHLRERKAAQSWVCTCEDRHVPSSVVCQAHGNSSHQLCVRHSRKGLRPCPSRPCPSCPHSCAGAWTWDWGCRGCHEVWSLPPRDRHGPPPSCSRSVVLVPPPGDWLLGPPTLHFVGILIYGWGFFPSNMLLIPLKTKLNS